MKRGVNLCQCLQGANCIYHRWNGWPRLANIIGFRWNHISHIACGPVDIGLATNPCGGPSVDSQFQKRSKSSSNHSMEESIRRIPAPVGLVVGVWQLIQRCHWKHTAKVKGHTGLIGTNAVDLKFLEDFRHLLGAQRIGVQRLIHPVRLWSIIATNQCRPNVPVTFLSFRPAPTAPAPILATNDGSIAP